MFPTSVQTKHEILRTIQYLNSLYITTELYEQCSNETYFQYPTSNSQQKSHQHNSQRNRKYKRNTYKRKDKDYDYFKKWKNMTTEEKLNNRLPS